MHIICFSLSRFVLRLSSVMAFDEQEPSLYLEYSFIESKSRWILQGLLLADDIKISSSLSTV